MGILTTLGFFIDEKALEKRYYNELLMKNKYKMKKLKRQLKKLNRENRQIFEFLVNHDLYDYDYIIEYQRTH